MDLNNSHLNQILFLLQMHRVPGMHIGFQALGAFPVQLKVSESQLTVSKVW